MRYPKHLVLDFTYAPLSAFKKTWAVSYQKTISLPTQKKVFTEKFFNLSSVTPRYLSPITLKTAPNYFPFFFKANINFLRKEKIYTKLKYSRCPQYDMVSGGLAALFSAFLGFLIAEKFGLELLDSGDFYILLMYVIFLVFACRPLVKLNSTFYSAPAFYSLNPAGKFYLAIGKLFISFWQRLTYLPMPLNYTFKDFYFWACRHEYISPVWNSTRFWIKFLKNYPRDDVTFTEAYLLWDPFLKRYAESGETFDQAYWTIFKRK